MSQHQIAALLFAAPFLALAIFFAVGSVLVERLDPAPVKIKREGRK